MQSLVSFWKFDLMYLAFIRAKLSGTASAGRKIFEKVITRRETCKKKIVRRSIFLDVTDLSSKRLLYFTK